MVQNVSFQQFNKVLFIIFKFNIQTCVQIYFRRLCAYKSSHVKLFKKCNKKILSAVSNSHIITFLWHLHLAGWSLENLMKRGVNTKQS